MKAFFTISVLLCCAYALHTVDIQTEMRSGNECRSRVMFIAQSRDANDRRNYERREDELREHEVAVTRQRDKELRELCWRRLFRPQN